MLDRMMRARSGALMALTAVMAGGCAAPGAAREVAGSQQRTIVALAGAYGSDIALLGDLLERTLAARRVMILGGLHREMLARGYITAGYEADVGRFEDDLGRASVTSALAGEVRLGRMSLQDARSFLVDYSLSMRMNDGGVARDAMLARLGAVIGHDASATALLAALAAHRAEVMALLEDADANARAIGEFAAHEPDAISDQTIRAIWDRAVLQEMDDPAERAAAQRLLDRVLGVIEEEHDG